MTKIAVLSAEHAQSDLNGTITMGTFLTPCMLRRSDFASGYTPFGTAISSEELPPASPQPVRAAAQAAPTPGDGATSAAAREAVHPALSILTEAARIASSATPTTLSALVAAIGSEHASNYAIAPHCPLAVNAVADSTSRLNFGSASWRSSMVCTNQRDIVIGSPSQIFSAAS